MGGKKEEKKKGKIHWRSQDHSEEATPADFLILLSDTST